LIAIAGHRYNIVEVPPAYCTMNDLLADLLVSLLAALAAVIASSLLDRIWESL
jgi:hypothetical protein